MNHNGLRKWNSTSRCFYHSCEGRAKAYWVDNEYTTTALEEMYNRLRLAWLLLKNGELDMVDLFLNSVEIHLLRWRSILTGGGHEGADAPAPCQTSTCRSVALGTSRRI